MVPGTELSGLGHCSGVVSPIPANHDAFSWLEGLIKWVGVLPNKDLNERKIESLLPDEAISCIFTCLTDPKSFANFAITSKNHYAVSKYLGSISAFSSYLLRKFWFIRDLEADKKGVYEAFNGRCLQIGINTSSKDFNFYVRTAMNHLVKTCGSKSRDSIAISFGESIYNDMINSYAALSASEITIDSFNAKAAQIKDLFSDDSIVDIEASMRQALIKNYGETFSELRKKHQFFIKTDPYSASLKKQYEQQLNAEKEVLCGSRDVLEVTNEALEKMKNAYFELNEAKESYLDRIAQLMSPISFSRRTEFSSLENLLNLIDGGSVFENPDPTLHRMGRKIQFLYAQHTDAKRRFKQLSLLQLKSINPDANFMLEFRMVGKFYEEMCQDVTTENKEERHLALHAIA